MVLWQLWSNGDEPAENMSDEGWMESLQSDLSSNGKLTVLKTPPKCPEQIQQMMVRCWSLDPDLRPPISEIVATIDLAKKGFLGRSEIATLRPTQNDNNSTLSNDFELNEMHYE